MKQKLKELTKDTAIYGISTILSRFLTFLLVPFYTHVFKTGEYGIIATIFAYLAFFNILYLYGMDSGYLKYASLEEGEKKKDVFSTSFLFNLITSIILTLLILLFSSQVQFATGLPEDKISIVYYIAFILFFDALAVIPFAYLRLNRMPKKFAAIRTINIIFNVGLNFILLLHLRMGIEGVFISNLASSLLTFILLLPFIIRNIKLNIDKEILKRALKFGIPYLPAGLASMVIQVINRPILQYLTNESTVGVFQANYKLGIFMMLFVSMFQYAWQPFFLNNAKLPESKEIFSKVLTYFILVSSFILVILSLFISDIVQVPLLRGRTLIHHDYWNGLNIIPVVLLAYLFNGLYYNFTAGIFIKEKTKYIPYVTGAGALINIAANFLFIPLWGMMGAALATLLSYMIMAIGLYFVSQKFYEIKYEGIKIIKITFSLLITAVFFYKIINESFFEKVLVLFLFIFLLLLLKVITKEEINSLIKILKFKKVKTVS